MGEEAARTGLAEVKFRLCLKKCQTLNRDFFMFLIQILTSSLTDKNIDDCFSSTLGSYGYTVERLLDCAGK